MKRMFFAMVTIVIFSQGIFAFDCFYSDCGKTKLVSGQESDYLESLKHDRSLLLEQIHQTELDVKKAIGQDNSKKATTLSRFHSSELRELKRLERKIKRIEIRDNTSRIVSELPSWLKPFIAPFLYLFSVLMIFSIFFAPLFALLIGLFLLLWILKRLFFFNRKK